MSEKVPITDPFGNLIGYIGGSGIGVVGAAVVIAWVICSSLGQWVWAVMAAVFAFGVIMQIRSAIRTHSRMSCVDWAGLVIGSILAIFCAYAAIGGYSG